MYKKGCWFNRTNNLIVPEFTNYIHFSSEIKVLGDVVRVFENSVFPNGLTAYDVQLENGKETYKTI